MFNCLAGVACVCELLGRRRRAEQCVLELRRLRGPAGRRARPRAPTAKGKRKKGKGMYVYVNRHVFIAPLGLVYVFVSGAVCLDAWLDRLSTNFGFNYGTRRRFAVNVPILIYARLSCKNLLCFCVYVCVCVCVCVSCSSTCDLRRLRNVELFLIASDDLWDSNGRNFNCPRPVSRSKTLRDNFLIIWINNVNWNYSSPWFMSKAVEVVIWTSTNVNYNVFYQLFMWYTPSLIRDIKRRRWIMAQWCTNPSAHCRSGKEWIRAKPATIAFLSFPRNI